MFQIKTIMLFGREYQIREVTHRIRRGKLVEIPKEWRGKIPHKQTMRKRGKKKK